MRHLFLAFASVLAFSAPAFAQTATTPTAQAKTVQIGQSQLSLTPLAGFSEFSDVTALYDFIRKTVPQGNDLLAAYLPTDELALIRAGKLKEMYGYIVVYAPEKVPPLTTSDFQQAVTLTQQSFTAITPDIQKAANAQLNTAAHAYSTDDMKINDLKVGEVKSLGSMFSKPEAYGHLLLIDASGQINGETRAATMIIGANIALLGNRLVSVNVYNVYDRQKSVDWISTTSQTVLNQWMASNPNASTEVVDEPIGSSRTDARDGNILHHSIIGAIIGGVAALVAGLIIRRRKS